MYTVVEYNVARNEGREDYPAVPEASVIVSKDSEQRDRVLSYCNGYTFYYRKQSAP